MKTGVTDNPFTTPDLVKSWHEKQFDDLEFHTNYWHFRKYRQKIGTMAAGQIEDEITVKNPETGETQTAYLIREKIEEDDDSGHMERTRVYSPLLSDIVHGDSVVFTPKDWNGLYSTHPNGGKVYGVSFDSKKYSYFTARKPIESIGEVEEVKTVSGSDSIIPPNGNLTLVYAGDVEFTIDCSLPATALKTSIESQTGLIVTVSKYGNIIELAGTEVDLYVQAKLENQTIESPFEITNTTGFVKIAWVSMTSQFQGLVQLAGAALINEGIANSNIQGSMTVNYTHGWSFTIPDISSLDAIKAWMENNGFWNVHVYYLDTIRPLYTETYWPFNAVGLHISASHESGNSVGMNIESISISGLTVPDVTIKAFSGRQYPIQ